MSALFAIDDAIRVENHVGIVEDQGGAFERDAIFFVQIAPLYVMYNISLFGIAA
jgi:hypothetical protein